MTDWRDPDLTGPISPVPGSAPPSPYVASPEPTAQPAPHVAPEPTPYLAGPQPDPYVTGPQPGPYAASPYVTGPQLPPVAAPDAGGPRPRRVWPKVVAVGVAALLLGLAAGVGGTFLVTNPSTDRLRDQRDLARSQSDEAKSQLDQAEHDLTVAQAKVTNAKSISDSCTRLVADSKDLVEQWKKLTAIFDDPANQDVQPGSARDQELADQFNTIAAAIDHDEGLIEIDDEICVATATTT